MPELLVVVSAGHSKTTLVGIMRVGWVVSRTVMVWRQLALLPQSSVAVQRRRMVMVPPQLLLMESVKVTSTDPQVSWAVATPVALVPVSAGHSSVRSSGQKIVGGVVSFTVTAIEQALTQPLLVTRRERVKLSAQFVPAATVTVWALVAPEIEPSPEMDQ